MTLGSGLAVAAMWGCIAYILPMLVDPELMLSGLAVGAVGTYYVANASNDD